VVLDAFGSGAGNIVSVVALITTMNTTLLVVTAASRMAYGMASQGDLPKVFARLHNRSAPRNAIAAALTLATLLLLVGDIHQLAAATDALIYLMFVLVNVIVIVLRVRKPDVVRTFRVPLAIGLVPVLPILGIAVTILMSSQLERSSVALASGLTLVGATLFFVVSMVNGKQRAKQK
jgi:APA family basic amino acid/polyamine antiporter